MSTMEGLTARGARKTVSTDDYAEPVATLSEELTEPAAYTKTEKRAPKTEETEAAVGPKMTLKDQRTHEAGTRRARLILVAVPLALLVWAIYDDAYGQHDDDAMDVVVRDLNAAADALESGNGNATAAATSKDGRKRRDASSLMMGLGIDNMDDMHPGAGRVKHGRKSLRSLVTNKPKEANARSKPDSKEAALKELESVASALKRATTAVRRKAGAGEKDLEEALKAEGISKAQVLSGVAARPHRSASIATHSAAARRQREALRERRASRSTAASDKDRGTARAVVHRRTQDEKRPRQTSHTHH